MFRNQEQIKARGFCTSCRVHSSVCYCQSISGDFASMSIRDGSFSLTNKQNQDGNRILNEILQNEIAIDKHESAHSISAIDAFMKELNSFLRSDPEYKYLFSTEYKTGSSFNHLKVSSADEYDINIVIIPPEGFRLEVEFFENKAFAKIKWREVRPGLYLVPYQRREIVGSFLGRISDSQGYIIPEEVKSWFQSVIDKFCLHYPNRKINNVKKFKNCASGPARTIQMETENGSIICLDLVPVFKFGFEIFSKNEIPRVNEYRLEETKSFCSFVPKVCEGGANLSARDCKISWRTYIPEIDKTVWHDKQFAKSIIKLLKLLRDVQKWQPIASYHMATVILWEIHENPSDYHWRGSNLFCLFIKALMKLQGYLKEKELPYFLYPQYNLFHKLDKNFSEDLSFRIKRLVQKLVTDPNYLTTIFDFN